MATLPGSNSSISFKEIQDEFGRGFNLNAYRNTSWFTDQNESGSFPNAPISFSDFRSKRKNSPVTANSVVITADVEYTVPLFNTMKITIRGAGGGGHGHRGIPWGNPGGGGTAGGSTAFGSYGTAGGGDSAGNGVDGEDAAGADGGSAGGVGFGSGGDGGKVVLFWSFAKAADKLHVGEKIQITIGKGGAGGGGGVNFGNLGQGWFPLGNAPSGAPGANGSVTIDIT